MSPEEIDDYYPKKIHFSDFTMFFTFTTLRFLLGLYEQPKDDDTKGFIILFL